MPTLADVRAQYPQYNDMSDADLSSALYSKFYSDMPRADFDKKIGLAQPSPDLRMGPTPISAADPSTLSDVVNSGGIGLVKGAIGLAGTPGDVGSIASKGYDAATNALGINPDLAKTAKDVLGAFYRYNPMTAAFASAPDSQQIQKGVESVTGGLYEPKTTAGQYAQTIGEFAPAALGGPESIASRIGTRVVAPALASETAGQLTQGSEAEPYARAIGALAGGVAPGALRRVVTPISISPERQALLNTLHQEGVTSLTAGQRTGNKALQYAESILGDTPGAGQGATGIQQEGQRQFTEAAMRRAGAGPNATPEVLAANQDRLGTTFNDLAARNPLQMDQGLVNDLGRAVRHYQNVPQSQQRAIVENYMNDIAGHIQNGGVMPGAQYQEMRSRLSRQAQSLRQSDPTLSQALRDMRDALDNNMARTISPQDAAAWQQARREYGAQKTLETAASRAGEATAEGQIVPSNLRNAAAVQNRGQYARGQGDFAQLARAGSGVMAPLPNSGTGQRAAINAAIMALGGGIGHITTGGLGTLAAAAAAPAAAGRALMSRPVQAYLANQLMQPGNRSEAARIAAFANLLAGARAPSLDKQSLSALVPASQ